MCSADSPYPPRTNWLPVGAAPDSFAKTSETLTEYADRLARVRSWLELPVPPAGANEAFPYRLALKRVGASANGQSADSGVIQEGTVVEGDALWAGASRRRENHRLHSAQMGLRACHRVQRGRCLALSPFRRGQFPAGERPRRKCLARGNRFERIERRLHHRQSVRGGYLYFADDRGSDCRSERIQFFRRLARPHAEAPNRRSPNCWETPAQMCAASTQPYPQTGPSNTCRFAASRRKRAPPRHLIKIAFASTAFGSKDFSLWGSIKSWLARAAWVN